MKTPAAVIEARATVDAKAAELKAARLLVERLTVELGASVASLRAARVATDSSLPQCRLVSIPWRSGKAEYAGMVVIERKTPAGKLVVRHVGVERNGSWFFEWTNNGQRFREVKSRDRSRTAPKFELRDVPDEFMPADAAARQIESEAARG